VIRLSGQGELKKDLGVEGSQHLQLTLCYGIQQPCRPADTWKSLKQSLTFYLQIATKSESRRADSNR
jgi:hypothetical protein